MASGTVIMETAFEAHSTHRYDQLKLLICFFEIQLKCLNSRTVSYQVVEIG